MMLFLCLFIAFAAFPQQYQYRMEGSFQTKAGPDSVNPATVNYQINWNETDKVIQGLYQDNYFTKNEPNVLVGTRSPDKRIFSIILPAPVMDVKELQFSGPGITIAGPLPLRTETRDRLGVVVDEQRGTALISSEMSATRSEAESGSCVIGFGALTKLCGFYGGLISEATDSRDSCDLMSRRIRLELAPDTSLNIVLDYTLGAKNSSGHKVGRLLPSPMTSTISLSSNHCGELQGVRFPIDHCKTLSLSGTFFSAPGSASFTGQYQISDQISGESCEYLLNLSRE